MSLASGAWLEGGAGFQFLPKERQPLAAAPELAAVLDHAVCGICLNIAADAVYHRRCRVLFCRACLQEQNLHMARAPGQQEDEYQCTLCREPVKWSELAGGSVLQSNFLDALLVECESCGQQMPRAKFDDHRQRVCLRACPHAGCAQQVTRAQFAAEHEASCAFRPVRCVNADLCCAWTGPVCELQAHRDACAYQALRAALRAVADKRLELARLRRPWLSHLNQKVDLEREEATGRWIVARVCDIRSTLAGVRVRLEPALRRREEDAAQEWLDWDSPRLQPLHTYTRTPPAPPAENSASAASASFSSSSSSSSSAGDSLWEGADLGALAPLLLNFREPSASSQLRSLMRRMGAQPASPLESTIIEFSVPFPFPRPPAPDERADDASS